MQNAGRSYMPQPRRAAAPPGMMHQPQLQHPHSASMRGMTMQQQHQMQIQQLQLQQQAQVQGTQPGAERGQDFFRRMSQVPTDKQMPDGLEDLVFGGEDVVKRYNDLRQLERQLDAVMISKRIHVRDSGLRYERRRRVMRIWISAKPIEKEGADTRMDDAFDFTEDAGNGSYKLRIEGRLLPDPGIEEDEAEIKEKDSSAMDVDKPDDAKPATKPSDATPKFSHYFKQINVKYVPSKHAAAGATVPPSIEWTRPPLQHDNTRPDTPEANFDCLEFERKYDEPVQKVVITLHRDEPLGRVQAKLSPALARLLDREYEDKSGAMMGLYTYVRANGLEDEQDPQRFHCDEALKPIFGTDTADFIYAPDFISKHLEPLPPITLQFTIRASGPDAAKPTVYDIPILVDDTLGSFTEALRRATDYHHPSQIAILKQIAQIDTDIAATMAAITQSKHKVNFLNSYTEDPVGFIRKFIASQSADLSSLAAERNNGKGPEWSRGGKDSIWASDAARENVGQVLARKPPA